MQKERKLLYTKPSITDVEIAYATDAAKNGWGENCYGYVDRFERDFSNFLKLNFCIATSSCTGALHMGLSAMGIKRGDEIILSDTNWIATVSPIYHLGATPIFVDIDFETLNISIKEMVSAGFKNYTLKNFAGYFMAERLSEW